MINTPPDRSEPVDFRLVLGFRSFDCSDGWDALEDFDVFGVLAVVDFSGCLDVLDNLVVGDFLDAEASVDGFADASVVVDRCTDFFLDREPAEASRFADAPVVADLCTGFFPDPAPAGLFRCAGSLPTIAFKGSSG